jgi:hypothetical protein
MPTGDRAGFQEFELAARKLGNVIQIPNPKLDMAARRLASLFVSLFSIWFVLISSI